MSKKIEEAAEKVRKFSRVESKRKRIRGSGFSQKRGYEVKKYFMVRIDKKDRAKDPVSLRDVEEEGFTIKPPRLPSTGASFDLFKNGKQLAKLFSSKADAMKWIDS